ARAADHGGPGAPDEPGAPGEPGEPGGRAAGRHASGPPSADAQPSGTPPRSRRRRRRVAAEWVIALAFAVVLATGLRAFVFEVFFVPTTSMVPALAVGDRILVQKAFFSWHDVRQGDILVFRSPPQEPSRCGGPPDPDLVKRVIALPGQTIYSRGNSIYVDGRKLAEPYLPSHDPLGPPIPHASASSPFRVPAGDFYMMGDNRAISCDSRYWGPIKGTSIVGQVILTIWRDGHPDLHFF
ncbi:MAG: signal peptidase I, partial [Streptosporangiaceae bacterium]